MCVFLNALKALLFGAVFLSCAAAWAFVDDGYDFNNSWVLYDDTVIGHDAVVVARRVNVESSLVLVNNGTVAGDVYVCPGCDLHIQGTGLFAGRIYTDTGSVVTRVISGHGDFGPLDVFGAYDVVFSGDIDMTPSGMLSAASGAGRVVFRDAKIPWSDSIKDALPKIELQGIVELDMSGVSGWRDKILLSGITGDGALVVSGIGADPLYAPMVSLENDTLWLRAVRETDYYKILGNNVGLFLNVVREVNPDDPTLAALDAAGTLDDLLGIIRHAGIFNPINFMRPVGVLNGFLADAVATDYSDGVTGVDGTGRVGVVVSSDFQMALATTGLGVQVGPALQLGITAYVANSNMANNEFGDAMMYGGNLRAEYNSAIGALVRGLYGRTYADIEAPYIFDIDRVVTNPRGVSDYGVFDLGWRFDVLGLMRVSPFVGMWYQDMRILSDTASDIWSRGGLDISWRIDCNDSFYDYRLRGVTRANGDWLISADVDFWSVVDGAGAGLSLAALQDDDIVAFRIGMQAKFRF